MAAVRAALDAPSPGYTALLAGIARRLRHVSPLLESEGQLLALVGVCRYFQKPGQDSALALEAAVLLGKRALSLGRPQERLSALMTQALIHDELENHLEALEIYGAARAVAREVGLQRAQMVSMVSGAQTLRQCGDFAGAESLARLALVFSESSNDLHDLCAQAWITIAERHLIAEDGAEGLAAVEAARRCLASAGYMDDGLVATIDYNEVLLQLVMGATHESQSPIDSLYRYAKRTRTVEARLLHSAARGAVELAQGVRTASIRLVTALERSRCLPRLMPQVLLAVLVAHAVIGENKRAGQLREELSSLFEGRRSAGKLKASLIRGPMVGLGALGRAFDTEIYELRVARAKHLLFEGQAQS
jgi:tetratricopeptide (TPR) repeat protein